MKELLYILFFFPFIVNAQHTFDRRYNEDLPLSIGIGLIETDDYYICYGSKGNFSQQDTTRPMFLVVDKQGNLINNQNFDNNVCYFVIHSYAQNNTNGYIGVGGTFSSRDTCGVSPNGYPTRSRMYLQKINNSGHLMWKKNYGDTIFDNNYLAAFDIVETNDKNYFVYGEKSFKTYILNINEQGDSLWSKTFEDYSTNKQRLNIKKTNDGFLCINFDSDISKLEVFKINDFAEKVWTKFLDLTLEDIQKTSDNNFVISSNSYTYPVYTTTLTKIDQEANILWTQDYYDTTYVNPDFRNFRAGQCVTETRDGNFVTAYKDLIKVNQDGEVLWKHRYINDNIWFYYEDVIETQDGGFLLTGRTGWTLQTILTKVDCNGNLEWTSESCLLPTEEEILVFPNPVQNQLTIQLPQINQTDKVDVFLYNILGQKIKKLTSENEQIFTIQTSSLNNGVYFYSIFVNNEKYKTGKIIKN